MSGNFTRPLAGRCALVTGSTAGIGLQTAEALGAMGADLVLNGFGEAATVAGLCASLAQAHGVRVMHHGADVSRPGDVEELIAAAQHHGRGRLDILVNNAGATYDAPVDAFPPERWDWQIALNLGGPFHAIRCALPGMRKAGWGRIVNVASAHGLVGMPNRAGYVAAKHALLGLTKVVALETADTPITCNAVCPAIVATERVVETHRRKAHERGEDVAAVRREVLSTRQPSGNYISSRDVAATIAFLCGPQAAEVRGAAWTVDGGYTAR